MVTNQDFTNFALPLINSGEADSIAQLVQQWETEREQQMTLESIQRGLDDIKAGRVRPAGEVFAAIRQELGLDR